MSDERIDVSMTMQELAILRESLIRTRDALHAAIEPFGLVTTWDAETRIRDVLGLVISARCDLKRRDPRYNPAGDSECEHEATDEELDRWLLEHPQEPQT